MMFEENIKNTRQHDRQADEAAVQGPTRKLLGRAWRSCKSHQKATPSLWTNRPESTTSRRRACCPAL